MQIALCLFNNGLKEYTRENCGDTQLYSFKIPDYLKDFIVEGSTAVAWTKNNLQIVKVVEIVDSTDERAEQATQYLISRVHVEAEKERQKIKLQIVTLKKKLEKEIAIAKEREELQKLATVNPEIESITKEIDSLRKVLEW